MLPTMITNRLGHSGFAPRSACWAATRLLPLLVMGGGSLAAAQPVQPATQQAAPPLPTAAPADPTQMQPGQMQPGQLQPYGAPPVQVVGADLQFQMQQLMSALTDHSRTLEISTIRRRNQGLLAGGSVLFALGYTGAIIGGSILLEENQTDSFARDSATGRNAGGVLLIPVLGPFISSLIMREPIWSLNWSLIDGMGQLGGVVMMTAAILSNRKLPSPLVGLRLSPIRTGTTQGLALTGAF